MDLGFAKPAISFIAIIFAPAFSKSLRLGSIKRLIREFFFFNFLIIIINIAISFCTHLQNPQGAPKDPGKLCKALGMFRVFSGRVQEEFRKCSGSAQGVGMSNLFNYQIQNLLIKKWVLIQKG